MTLLHGLAAAMAGLDRLAVHTGDPGGRAPLDAALRLTRDDLSTGETVETHELIGRIATMGLEWGVSDGNRRSRHDDCALLLERGKDAGTRG